MLKNLLFDEPMKAEHRHKFERVWLAQQFPGWSLEYIDGLSLSDRQSIMAVISAQNKHRQNIYENRKKK